MEIILDKINATEANITVKISHNDCKEEIEKNLKDVAKRVHINGFRPGKVPAQMVKKMYGASIISESVMQKAGESIYDYVKENTINMLGQPILSEESPAQDWLKQDEYQVIFKIGMVMPFEIDYSKIEVVSKETYLSEQELQQELKNKQLQFANTTRIDNVTENSSIELSIYKKNEAGEKTIEETIKFLYDDFSEEVQNKILGMPFGTTLEVQLETLLKDEKILTNLHKRKYFKSENSIEMTTGLATLEIISIESIEMPEMNEEFYKNVYPSQNITNEQEFLAAVEKDVLNIFLETNKNILYSIIELQLLDIASIELPDNFLKEWLLINASKNKKTVSKKDIEDYYPYFKTKTIIELIINDIFEKNEIKVGENEIKTAAKEHLRNKYPFYNQVPSNLLDDLVSSMIKENRFKDEIEDILFIARKIKAYEWIASQANLKVEKVSTQEFNEYVKSFNASVENKEKTLIEN
jgi:trigger factor